MTRTNKSFARILTFILALTTMLSAFSFTAEAASKTPAACYVAVKKAYGSSFPLTSADRIKGKSRVMGVRTANFSSYYAASKVKGSSGSQCEYIIFIGKAKTKKKAKQAKTALAKYIKNEQASMVNYLSSTGKSLFANAKTGRKGKFVWLVMIDTSGNSKAINAIQKTLS